MDCCFAISVALIHSVSFLNLTVVDSLSSARQFYNISLNFPSSYIVNHERFSNGESDGTAVACSQEWRSSDGLWKSITCSAEWTTVFSATFSMLIPPANYMLASAAPPDDVAGAADASSTTGLNFSVSASGGAGPPCVLAQHCAAPTALPPIRFAAVAEQPTSTRPLSDVPRYENMPVWASATIGACCALILAAAMFLYRHQRALKAQRAATLSLLNLSASGKLKASRAKNLNAHDHKTEHSQAQAERTVENLCPEIENSDDQLIYDLQTFSTNLTDATSIARGAPESTTGSTAAKHGRKSKTVHIQQQQLELLDGIIKK
ncbi:hypothetical protein HDU83_009649 [Entophlyctis luteolus]|nr:hypothetical protein HDU83_009649 [Entophlyctis luteolus]